MRQCLSLQNQTYAKGLKSILLDKIMLRPKDIWVRIESKVVETK